MSSMNIVAIKFLQYFIMHVHFLQIKHGQGNVDIFLHKYDTFKINVL